MYILDTDVCSYLTIGAYDLQIAGHARSLGATLVTNNLREFSGVSGLRLANWVSGSDAEE